MSLVPTYVKATDDYFYKNPILQGNGWFICFDDDEPPELVIADESPVTPEYAFELANIKYSHLRKGTKAERVFGKGWKFKPTQSYFFRLKSKLNPQRITEHDGRVKTINVECVFYDPDL